MSAHSEFRQALRERDIPLLRRASAILFPAQPLPEDDLEATAQMHIARTMQSWMTVQERAFSHFWLLDSGLPSMLPDEMLPQVARFEPTVQRSVGVSHGTGKEWLKPASPLIVRAMTKAVTDNQELIDKDPDALRDKIIFAKSDEFRRLFGAATATEVER